jgi:hypothetical protein
MMTYVEAPKTLLQIWCKLGASFGTCGGPGLTTKIDTGKALNGSDHLG